jgi:hypothetical protein
VVDRRRVEEAGELGERLKTMYVRVQEVGGIEPADVEAVYESMNETTKRDWEKGSLGYVRWAVQQLVSRGRGGQSHNVQAMADTAAGVGTTESLREVVSAESNIK